MCEIEKYKIYLSFLWYNIIFMKKYYIKPTKYTFVNFI